MANLVHAAITRFRFFRSDEEGASMVEYGLLLALIAVVAIGAIYTLGDNITGMFEQVGDEIETPGSTTD